MKIIPVANDPEDVIGGLETPPTGDFGQAMDQLGEDIADMWDEALDGLDWLFVLLCILLALPLIGFIIWFGFQLYYVLTANSSQQGNRNKSKQYQKAKKKNGNFKNTRRSRSFNRRNYKKPYKKKYGKSSYRR